MKILPEHLRQLEPSPRVRSQRVQDLAAADPILAATLATGLLTPGGYADTGGWEIVTLAARWDTPGIGQVVEASMFSATPGGAAGEPGTIGVGRRKGGGGVLEANLWVRAVTYTVRRPKAFEGSIFKAQSDWTFARVPFIDATLQFVTPFCKAEVSIPPTPLELMPTSFDTSFPAGFLSRSDASINCSMVNRRQWVDVDSDDSDLPVEAIIALHCWRLPLGPKDPFQQEAARALLRELGYTV